jgi:hypothetical protein
MTKLNFYYILAGIENAQPVNIKFTFLEVANNIGEHKDSEIFFSLQEQSETFEKLELYKPFLVSINRDDDDCKALIVKIPSSRFNAIEINN